MEAPGEIADPTVTDSGVYYTGRYWNDYPEVVRHLNRLVSGDPDTTWHQHFAQGMDRRFERALILNCGNGWVERDLHRLGIIDHAVGIDVSDDLLDDARRGAEEAGLDFEYHQMDTNRADFPEGPFDLVVNHAAAHHITRLDRVFRRVCELLPADGALVSYDYVGAHRNQYPIEDWVAAWELNQELPSDLRQDLRYPHLPTMLATDPTEAVHSELVLPIHERYFSREEYVPFGGALAYPILTFNDALFDAEPQRRRRWVDHVLEADIRYTEESPGSTLFAYFWGHPRKDILTDQPQLRRWEEEERSREEEAAANDGHYYPLTLLQALYLELEDQRIAALHARTDLERLQGVETELARESSRADELEREANRVELERRELEARVQELTERLDSIYESRTWRVGNALARLPRAIRSRFERDGSLGPQALPDGSRGEETSEPHGPAGT